MKRAALMAILWMLFAATAWAKLPAPPPMTEEQKAKAADAKAKAAETAKKEAALLSRYQDKAAENYRKGHGKAKGTAGATPAKPKK